MKNKIRCKDSSNVDCVKVKEFLAKREDRRNSNQLEF